MTDTINNFTKAHYLHVQNMMWKKWLWQSVQTLVLYSRRPGDQSGHTCQNMSSIHTRHYDTVQCQQLFASLFSPLHSLTIVSRDLAAPVNINILQFSGMCSFMRSIFNFVLYIFVHFYALWYSASVFLGTYRNRYKILLLPSLSVPNTLLHPILLLL